MQTCGVFLTCWLRNVLRATTAWLFRHRNFQKWSGPLVFFTFWLRNVLRATTACTFSTSQLPKVVRTPRAFYILTSKCASRHNGVHFFDIATSKSGPTPSAFHILTWKCASRHNSVHFFDIATSKSGPNPWWFFLTFWLRNVLRATTACTFSTSQLPKVVRTPCVFNILTWKSASRHNSVQFFICHLARWLSTRCFSEPTFRTSGATNHWKNTVSRLSYLFAHLHLLSSDSFSSLICSLLLFSSLCLFPSLLFICPYCWKFDF